AAGLVPFQEDTAAVYRALDVVVHASTQPEPFGLTIAEAMSCSRPVVVARAGGAAGLFSRGPHALGGPPRDAPPPPALPPAPRAPGGKPPCHGGGPVPPGPAGARAVDGV